MDQRTLRTWGCVADLDVVCFEYTGDTSPMRTLLFVWWILIVGLTSSPCLMNNKPSKTHPQTDEKHYTELDAK